MKIAHQMADFIVDLISKKGHLKKSDLLRNFSEADVKTHLPLACGFAAVQLGHSVDVE